VSFNYKTEQSSGLTTILILSALLATTFCALVAILLLHYYRAIRMRFFGPTSPSARHLNETGNTTVNTTVVNTAANTTADVTVQTDEADRNTTTLAAASANPFVEIDLIPGGKRTSTPAPKKTGGGGGMELVSAFARRQLFKTDRSLI